MSAEKWRTVACPKCGAAVGSPCGRRRKGASAQWERTAYHAARINAAMGWRAPDLEASPDNAKFP